MFTKTFKLVAEEMLQSLTFRIALLGMVLQPHIMFKGTSRILLSSGDNLRKQFLRLHHLDGSNAVEERKDTLVDGSLTRFLIVTQLAQVTAHQFIQFPTLLLVLCWNLLYR